MRNPLFLIFTGASVVNAGFGAAGSPGNTALAVGCGILAFREVAFEVADRIAAARNEQSQVPAPQQTPTPRG